MDSNFDWIVCLLGTNLLGRRNELKVYNSSRQEKTSVILLTGVNSIVASVIDELHFEQVDVAIFGLCLAHSADECQKEL